MRVWKTDCLAALLSRNNHGCRNGQKHDREKVCPALGGAPIFRRDKLENALARNNDTEIHRTPHRKGAG
jgi:hypothetical protein